MTDMIAAIRKDGSKYTPLVLIGSKPQIVCWEGQPVDEQSGALHLAEIVAQRTCVSATRTELLDLIEKMLGAVPDRSWYPAFITARAILQMERANPTKS